MVSPVIDILNKDDMSYTLASPVVKGRVMGGLNLTYIVLTTNSTTTNLTSVRQNIVFGLLLCVSGGFSSNLHFKWDTMTPKETRSRSPIDPIRYI